MAIYCEQIINRILGYDEDFMDYELVELLLIAKNKIQHPDDNDELKKYKKI